jgi:predicted HAD superfamily Cof-like phosphohydrolase
MADSMTLGEMVREFHEAFGLVHTGEPRSELPYYEQTLRFRLFDEERIEYIEALQERDVAHIMKELADQLYILAGDAIAFGCDIDAALEEVHRSNMTKVRGGHRGDGKILKGPGYVEADPARLVRALT